MTYRVRPVRPAPLWRGDTFTPGMFGARWPGGRDPADLAASRHEARRGPALVPTRSTCQGCDRHAGPGWSRGARCGTRSGFQAHGRRDERPCACCREAERDYQYLRHLRRKGAA